LKGLLRHYSGQILGNPEIGELPAVPQAKHVFWLQIAMDDLVLVKFAERCGHADGNFLGLLDGQSTPGTRPAVRHWRLRTG
jgi:hypothetical protein